MSAVYGRGLDGQSTRTQKQVVCVWTWSSDLEDLHHIKELAVYVTNDGDWRPDMHHIALLHE